MDILLSEHMAFSNKISVTVFLSPLNFGKIDGEVYELQLCLEGGVFVCIPKKSLSIPTGGWDRS